MIANDKPNPFQVLGLPTDASNDDIVSRSQELSDLAASEEERLLVRWAVEQLITHPFTRLEYELFEIPGARYEDEEWEELVRKNRRNPVDLEALRGDASPPRLEDFDLAALLALLLDALLEAPPIDIRPALEAPPAAPDAGAPPLEVAHVVFG